jgi:hypothetical protein
MDEQTFERYKEYVVEDKTATIKELKYLTQKEQALYSRLKNQRLEQERIPFDFIEAKIIYLQAIN